MTEKIFKVSEFKINKIAQNVRMPFGIYAYKP